HDYSARAFTACSPPAEGWPSGLRRTLGKRVYGKPYRGFESHSLRQPYVCCHSTTFSLDARGRQPRGILQYTCGAVFSAKNQSLDVRPVLTNSGSEAVYSRDRERRE